MYQITIEVNIPTEDAQGLAREDVWDIGKQICAMRLKGLDAHILKVHEDKEEVK